MQQSVSMLPACTQIDKRRLPLLMTSIVHYYLEYNQGSIELPKLHTTWGTIWCQHCWPLRARRDMSVSQPLATRHAE